MTARLARRIDRQSWMSFFTHLTVILLIFVLPELMFRYSKPHTASSPWTLYVGFKTMVYLAIFYLNYFVIIDKTLLSGRYKVVRFVGMSLLVVIVAEVILCFAQNYVLVSQGWERHHSGDRMLIRNASFMLRDAAMMVLTIGLSSALKFGDRWSSIQNHHEKLLASQREAELQNLKNQLNPHFLFNTLNTIYALVDISPSEAQTAIKKLSSLLRYALYENPGKVKLSREADFVKNYISLMEIRLGSDKIDAHFSIDPEGEPEVPPLLFVTLIENAFKHGNTGNDGEKIMVSIESDADGDVVCRTVNNFIPSAEKNPSEGGIGIANLRRRLQLLYPDCSSLDIEIDGNKYKSTLTIRNAHD